jgi:hypothetical protein
VATTARQAGTVALIRGRTAVSIGMWWRSASERSEEESFSGVKPLF